MAKIYKSVSIIVPVFNEIAVIKQFHRQLIGKLQSLNLQTEVLYIDDNSTDGTYEYLKSVCTPLPATRVRKKRSTSLTKSLRPKDLDGSIQVIRKIGIQGKAYSLQQGFSQATGDLFVMIDGDLQYSPADIPGMIQALSDCDVIVANRKTYNASLIRRIFSTTFKYGFGMLVFGLNCDIQSGLKVFTRKVYEVTRFNPDSAWTFDLEFLYRTQMSGYQIKNYDITFAQRKEGRSKVKILETALEIGLNAFQVKLKNISNSLIKPSDAKSMRGAGIGYNQKRYITHSTLSQELSAVQTFTFSQKIAFSLFVAFILFCLTLSPLRTLQVFVGALSLLYFFDLVFNLVVVLRTLDRPDELSFKPEQIAKLTDDMLPIYTILCPLYNEAHVMPQFLKAIEALDYPKEKLDVLILLEEDDIATIDAIKTFVLPNYIQTLIVPDSLPKTKPKACNYGLSQARGEYLVIYDAEDIPDTDQLKKAFLGFSKAGERVSCLQAKLNYYNTNQNMLTKFFTAEYLLWFDLTLTGLQALNSSIPLGGTSNHFKTKHLRDLEGWDAFNVTEDADLGIRLFQKGYKTAILDSTTFEEANSVVANWLRQRSRWIKGYMQTYLVHMRHPVQSTKKTGLFHHLIFEFTVGGKILFMLLNPLMWVITFSYYALYPFVSSTVERVYIVPLSYFGVVSAVFGNFLFFFCYMIACGKKNQWDLIKYTFLIPYYWVLMSIAGYMALYQLFFKPHYWEKTIHGLHLLTDLDIASIPAFAGPIGYVEPAVAPVFQQATMEPLFAGNMHVDQYMPTSIGEKAGASIAVSTTIGEQNFLSHADIFVSSYWANQYNNLVHNLQNLLNQAKVTYERIIIGSVRWYHTFVLFSMPSTGIGHVIYERAKANFVKVIRNNVQSIVGLFRSPLYPTMAWKQHRLRILIFNWRDTKHIYTGGAEVYVQQLAKHWVQDGNSVTLFCGNDNRNESNETLDGVNIVRRGGTYTVYLFAVIYYLLKFRGKYDLIIDCENGIPFFTPFFVRKPIILVIHHVHQEVFRVFLSFPFGQIARFLEGKLMPIVYQNKSIITVSESSKMDILELGFTRPEAIEIIHNGVDTSSTPNLPKTTHPSFLYLGRLKAYKNIDIAIKAFASVLKTNKNATLTIAGYGEMYPSLTKLVLRLGIDKSVNFLGYVTEDKKAKLLSESWALIQPSLIEGWGITVIEANAKGTPVIASNVAGLRDSVIDGQTGVLVKPKDIGGFSNAMERIMKDKVFLSELSNNSYEWSKKFGWDKSAQRFYYIIGKSFGEITPDPAYADLLLTVNK